MSDFDITYPGESHEATVPDTLDLADRAELAINGVGGTIDPALHYQMYFRVRYAVKTPFMSHHGADTTCDPKYAESFPMMRLMCGSDRYADLEAGQRSEILSRLQDGLYWNLYDPRRPWCTSYNVAFDGERRNEDLANVAGNGRMLRALVTWRELSGDPAWDKPTRALVEGLARIAIERNGYVYYPDGGFGEPFNYPRSGWVRTDEPLTETEGGEGSVTGYQGHQIQGLARWVALSGDEQALELARKLTRFCMLPKFWGGVPDPNQLLSERMRHVAAPLPDPACVAGAEQAHWYSHFHARAIPIRGMLEYATVAPDWPVLEFVRRFYEYSWSMGIPRTGWVNCYPGSLSNNMVEGCALGDLVALGIRLSDAGMGDYWDDVDAVVRNHLIEGQLVRADLLQRVADASPERPADQVSPYPWQETTADVIARSLGNFAGHSTPNSIPKPWVMQCCTGNGTQGLYYAWEGIVREHGDSAQVNLLLNRAAAGLDVDSYLPYEGRVVMHNKSLRRISVRIPSWAPRREVRAIVAGAPRPLEWVGNYLRFDDLKPGEKIEITFPVQETTASYTASARTKDEQTYRGTFRGSTLVDISPRDEAPTSYPLYLRDHLRGDTAPLRKVTRFVPATIIRRW